MALQINDIVQKMILWCDIDKTVENQVDIIRESEYGFKYFSSTKELILFYKANGTHISICGIITSSLSHKPNGDKSGVEMIAHLKEFSPVMKNSNPVFGICSLSIKQHHSTNLISDNKQEIQKKVIAAIKHNANNHHSCKAKGCNANHSSHYCKLCNTKGSNHRAMECKSATTLYHGTKAQHFNSIINQCDGSLFESRCGRLGKGVYFTPSADHATTIGKYWPEEDGKGFMVLTCKVALGKMKKKLELNDPDEAGSWRKEYDSCSGLHPAWLSFKNGECKEYVIKDANKFRISEVTLYDCHIDEDIFAPRLVIKLKNSTINEKRNITVGRIEKI